MKTTTNSKELIQLCAKNNRKAQEQLYKQYFDAMFSIGLRYTSDQDKIIEWVNNGFLKVFQKIHTVRNEESLPGWIRSVVYRSILDGIRSEKKYWQAMVFDEEYRMHLPIKQTQSIDFELIKKQIQELPNSTQKVFELFVLEGYSHNEIALEMNISEGTSKWHVSNARKLLKQILNDKNIVATG